MGFGGRDTGGRDDWRQDQMREQAARNAAMIASGTSGWGASPPTIQEISAAIAGPVAPDLSGRAGGVGTPGVGGGFAPEDFNSGYGGLLDQADQYIQTNPVSAVTDFFTLPGLAEGINEIASTIGGWFPGQDPGGTTVGNVVPGTDDIMGTLSLEDTYADATDTSYGDSGGGGGGGPGQFDGTGGGGTTTTGGGADQVAADTAIALANALTGQAGYTRASEGIVYTSPLDPNYGQYAQATYDSGPWTGDGAIGDGVTGGDAGDTGDTGGTQAMTSALLAGYYQDVFNREPGPAAQDWLTSGMSPPDVLAALENSPEAQVIDIYRNTLNRTDESLQDPEVQANIAAWVHSGMTIEQIAAAIAGSPEALALG